VVVIPVGDHVHRSRPDLSKATISTFGFQRTRRPQSIRKNEIQSHLLSSRSSRGTFQFGRTNTPINWTSYIPGQLLTSENRSNQSVWIICRAASRLNPDLPNMPVSKPDRYADSSSSIYIHLWGNIFRLRHMQSRMSCRMLTMRWQAGAVDATSPHTYI
jgi:hypothetical protein